MFLWSAFAIGTLLWVAHAQVCVELKPELCASQCVPRNAGTPAQADFGCGDWWSIARCCNGTETQDLVTTTYSDCSCESEFRTFFRQEELRFAFS